MVLLTMTPSIVEGLRSWNATITPGDETIEGDREPADT